MFIGMRAVHHVDIISVLGFSGWGWRFNGRGFTVELFMGGGMPRDSGSDDSFTYIGTGSFFFLLPFLMFIICFFSGSVRSLQFESDGLYDTLEPKTISF